MRAVSVARRLLAFPRMTVGSWRFEADEVGGKSLVIPVRVRGRSRCSRCGRKCQPYDRLKPRRWRQLDFGGWVVQLEARLRRVDCLRYGVVVEQVPWADPGSRFARPF
jgi:transposase